MVDDHTPTPVATTLVEILRWRALHQGSDVAFTLLKDGEEEELSLSYGELDTLCRRVAARLQDLDAVGQPVLLVYPPGRDFLVGYLGCLYAGAIAVPIYPPDPRRMERTLPRFQAIATDCGATVALTQAANLGVVQAIGAYAPDLKSMRWASSDDLPAGAEDAWREPAADPEAIAFLQYTSGSTGTPKGVVVSHGALMGNFALITTAFGSRHGEAAVTWLPNYHDMGLIDGLLRPFFYGGHCVVMSPIDFLKKPVRWLRAISRYRAVSSGGPNFAYDLCLRKVSDADRAELDLSCWRIAYNGAEPVRADTIASFAKAFAACGFRESAMFPCYGLAEATLFVSGGSEDVLPTQAVIDRDALEESRVVPVAPEHPKAMTLVGAGPSRVEALAIVDPTTMRRLPADRVGEIWVSGSSMASGYWRRPDVSRATFDARIADGDGRPWLRTGDLGFLRAEDGEVFITGRQKDLIIVRGRNHYPQDIERTIEDSHPALFRPGCNAAFSVEVDGEERVVIAQELQRRHGQEDPKWRSRRSPDPRIQAFAPELDSAPDTDAVVADIRGVVAEKHGIQLHAVMLVKPGTIHKTSSGKIQRHACRRAFLKGSLDVVHEWRPDEGPAAIPVAPDALPSDDVRRRLRELIAARVHVNLAELNDDTAFASLGLDSKDAVELVGELEELLQRNLDATLLYDHPSVTRLWAYLSGQADPSSESSVGMPGPGEDAARGEGGAVAIIGIGCRFPGAEGPEAFWRLLREGRDATSEVPRDRWDANALYDPDPGAPGKTTTRRGGFIEGVGDFDARFFGISPREAARMDPQQRMFLEVAWGALDNAGYTRESIAGSQTGVFVGVSNNDYARHIFSHRDGIDAYHATGTAFSIAANRISYLFDLRGPSLAIDTACSSALVALDNAVRAIQQGLCGMAIAGGVNAILAPDITINFSKAGVMAPDGRCKAFDARADGYARGEGAGAVVLKPLARARADGDPIYAVIRGSAINNDGRSNGLMAPNGAAQEAAVRAAWKRAGVAPGSAQYIEAHGTGTALGDPIEVKALSAVVGAGRATGEPCALGSVKTNIGHLESAAGIAGLIKVALAIHHGELPRSLHYETPNPHIAFDRLPLRVQQSHEPWPQPRAERLAGVSSFGFGGTNAHVVLSGAPAPDSLRPEDTRTTQDQPTLLALSAPTEATLATLAGAYADLLEGSEAAPGLGIIAASAASQRTAQAVRLALVGEDASTVAGSLRAVAAGDTRPEVLQSRSLDAEASRVVFVMPGQGPQWWAMGRELMAKEPVFLAAMERCDALLEPLSGWSLLTELGRAEAESAVNETRITQPALFAMSIALAEVWRSRGVEPWAILGHSMGEVAAACLAGALPLEDAIRVIFHRGRLMQTVSGIGRMAAVELPLADTQELLRAYEGRLAVAANNSATGCAISGDPDAIREVIKRLDERGVFARELRIDLAAHSPHMDALIEPFAEAIGSVGARAPERLLVSSLTGEQVGEACHSAEYWTRNLRQPVLFHRAVETLLAQGAGAFIELSPHPVLLGAIAESAKDREVVALASAHRKRGELRTLLSSLGALWVRGADVDLGRSFKAPAPRHALPTTPLERERFWVDLPATGPAPGAMPGDAPHPLLHRYAEIPAEAGLRMYETDLSLATVPFIDDHRVQDVVVHPATAYLEMAGAAAAATLPGQDVVLGDVRFLRALTLAPDERRHVTTVLRADPASPARWRFQIHSRPTDPTGGPWTLHAEGDAFADEDAPLPGGPSLSALLGSLPTELDATAHYESYDARGIQYGPAFQGLQELRRRDGEALGRITLPSELHVGLGRYRAHPALLDACLQVMAAALPEGADDARETFMPVGLERLRVHGEAGTEVWSHVLARPRESQDSYCADVLLLRADGSVWGEARGLTVRRVDQARMSALKSRGWFYEVAWQDAPRPVDPRIAETRDEAWLVISQGAAWHAQIARMASEAGLRVAEANVVDLLRDDAMAHLLDQANERLGGAPSRVVFLAGSNSDDGAGQGDPASPETLELGAGALLRLAQALEARSQGSSPLLWIVTRDAQSEPGPSSHADLAQAPVWGLARTLPHEFPGSWGGILDLSGTDESSVEAAIREIMLPEGDDQIAWRDGRRMVPRLRPSPPPTEDEPLVLDPEASYLVTGGLGAIGRRLAAWLAQRGARHLVLTTRGQAPAPEDWAELGTAGDERWRDLAALRSQGVDVVVRTSDVADAQATRELIANFGSGLPALKGVFHAAGVVTPIPGAALRPEDLRQVCASKVAGSWNLHAACAALTLDHFVLFSSGSAIWGSKLLAHYGAANAFLDALARQRLADGSPALSVAWGMWGGSGMSAEGANARELERLGMRAVDPSLALEVLGALMVDGVTTRVVADIDWAVLRPLYEQGPRRGLLRELPMTSSSAPETSRGDVAARAQLLEALAETSDPQGRLTLVDDLLVREATAVLGIAPDQLKRDVSLTDQGMDSLTGAELRARLERALGLTVNVLQLLRGQGTSQLAQDLLGQLETLLAAGDDASSAVVKPLTAVGADDEVLAVDVTPDPAATAPADPPREILLTGATGFLGAFLLAELARRTDARLHCLVRAPSDAAARERLEQTLRAYGIAVEGFAERVVVVAGDLARPHLGLSDARWLELAEGVDAIHHVGYLVNFLFSYEDLRPTNVGGSVELLRLACTGRAKRCHFVSSFSVYYTAEYTGRVIESGAPLYAGAGAYRETKRACEGLIASARERGVAVDVYRPPFISWHSGSGVANERDFLIKLVEGCLLLGVAPDVELVFHLAPVDFVVAAIVDLASNPAAKGGSFNIIGEGAGTRWPALVALMQQAGAPLRLAPYDEWREALRRAGDGNPLSVFFPKFSEDFEDQGAAVMELFHERFMPARFDTDHLEQALKPDTLCPTIDVELVRPYLGRALKDKA